MVIFEEMSEDDDDESDKHLEARDRRYSCSKCVSTLNVRNYSEVSNKRIALNKHIG